MSVKVLKPGLLTTIQDKGRVGFEAFGMPVAGAMDTYAAELANCLVNNSKDTAVLECTQIGPTLTFTKPTTIALTGANMQAMLNGVAISRGKAIAVSKNDVLALGFAISGVRTYISFSGGILVDKTLNSKSTYVPAQIGGVNGLALKKHDVFNIGAALNNNSNSKVKRTTYSNNLVLEVLNGPEWDLLSVENQESLLGTTYTASLQSSRMGIRLEGTAISIHGVNEIISSGIVKGTVQLTKGGTPIVMMADAPTTGGYLRVFVLTTQSINLLAQLPSGGSVRFRLKNE
ncbi:biotin-dependent carboxyltransferase family protein [Flavobacteriaceae bacterium]|nr:biotin-dependent carboxyltransferase family protein [Flavobacteriaceae bacterium]